MILFTAIFTTTAAAVLSCYIAGPRGLRAFLALLVMALATVGVGAALMAAYGTPTP